MTKHDVRCKGTKTDEDLINEFLRLENSHCSCYRFDMYDCRHGEVRAKKLQLIEKEVGTEAIEKERLERRLKRLEERAFRPWWKCW